MAYDLEEQEQLASLKAWWAKFGNMVTTVVLVVALAFASWNGWNWYQLRQAAAATGAYEDLQTAVSAKDMARVKAAAGVLFDQYSRTAYAQMGGLLAAKANFEAGDARTAKAQLQWVIDNARDESFKLVARLRLAGLLLDEGANDAALQLVSGTVPAGYEVAFADRRGDVLFALKKVDEARAAYQLALDKTEARNPYRQIVQLKLDDLGAASAPATTPAAVPAATGDKK